MSDQSKESIPYAKLDYQKSDDIWLQNSITLRKLIGISGVLLPLLLWFFLWLYAGKISVLESISHYYYTRVDGIFTITISLIAVFLIVYKGKELIDFILSFVAGISALILVLFPTSPIISEYPTTGFTYANTILGDNPTRETVHFVAAGIFLLILATMSIFLFTKTNKSKHEMGKQKAWRNRLYKTCSIGMILAMAVIGLGALNIIDADFYNNNNLTFWMEVVAVELFGISWLVKGETIFKDKA